MGSSIKYHRDAVSGSVRADDIRAQKRCGTDPPRAQGPARDGYVVRRPISSFILPQSNILIRLWAA